MAKAKKTKAGTWRIQIYMGRDKDGKQIIKSITAPTKKEAERMALEYRTRNAKPTRETVGMAIDDYISIREAVLSPATLRNYKAAQRSLKKHFPDLMDTRLDAVTERKAQELSNGLAKRYTPKSMRLYIDLFEMALRARGIRFENITYPQKPKRDVHIPSTETARAIFTASRGTDMEIPIILAACGLRASEICAVTADDIDGDILHISKARVAGEKGYVTKTPKTQTSDRYIRLPAGVADRIRQQGCATRKRPDNLSACHSNFLKSHGFEHFRLHDWRHFMCSLLHDIGCSDEFIMAWGGWSSNYTMTRVYRHLMADRVPVMAEKATAEMETILPPRLVAN